MYKTSVHKLYLLLENSKNHKKVILFNSTLTVKRCDGDVCHLFMIFAVFDVSVIACHR